MTWSIVVVLKGIQQESPAFRQLIWTFGVFFFFLGNKQDADFFGQVIWPTVVVLKANRKDMHLFRQVI